MVLVVCGDDFLGIVVQTNGKPLGETGIIVNVTIGVVFDGVYV